ncbi:MAG TPA: DUF2834 domain-containing protein [Nevskiaceae bacterium]|nr:DUF2834 domain-containing protein [Nevskiaceae bacterium]
MNRTVLLLLILLPFAALTAVALRDHGYIGIFTSHFTSSAGLQVLTDLIIACTLAIVWMIGDARRSGRNPWPYVLLTLTLGSFGPLLYLLVGSLRSRPAQFA